MRLLVVSLFAIACATAGAAEHPDVFFQGALEPNNITPTFDKGYLLVFDYPKVDVYSPDGAPVMSVSPRVEGAQWAMVNSAAVDTDGTVAAAIEYVAQKTRRGGISVFESTGIQSCFFVTGNYLPTQVAFAQDHSLWTLGWSGLTESKEDYPVLQHFSQKGEPLGGFLMRSSFRSEVEPIGPCTGCVELRVAGRRIEALFFASSITKPGQQTPPEKWIELDATGDELGRYDVGERSLISVFTPSGGVYRQHDGAIETFDRTTRIWSRVSIAPAGYLLGADADALVFLLNGKNTLSRTPVAQ